VRTGSGETSGAGWKSPRRCVCPHRRRRSKAHTKARLEQHRHTYARVFVSVRARELREARGICPPLGLSLGLQKHLSSVFAHCKHLTSSHTRHTNEEQAVESTSKGNSGARGGAMETTHKGGTVEAAAVGSTEAVAQVDESKQQQLVHARADSAGLSAAAARARASAVLIRAWWYRCRVSARCAAPAPSAAARCAGAPR